MPDKIFNLPFFASEQPLILESSVTMVNTSNKEATAIVHEPLVDVPDLDSKKKENPSQKNDEDLKKNLLGEIRKAIPSQAFKKDLLKSLYYMFFDYALWGATYFAFSTFVKSDIWSTLPFILKAISTLIYWNLAGLFMWCQFVIGHDCGHGSFSNYQIINDIFGHISHGSLLVPFWPWQVK